MWDVGCRTPQEDAVRGNAIFVAKPTVAQRLVLLQARKKQKLKKERRNTPSKIATRANNSRLSSSSPSSLHTTRHATPGRMRKRDAGIGKSGLGDDAFRL